ncbi:MAG: TetR family transcriptional regulator [Alsobacter sp.]
MAEDVAPTDTRCRIVRQAEEFFRLYGYQKTTVADIAKALRMSPANVYRFFDSKKSINEEVALRLMGEVEAAALEVAESGLAAPERFRRFIRTIHEMSASRYIADRKMHEMVAIALEESWPIVQAHVQRIDAMLARIITDGVASGDFKVREPAVAARCVHAAMLKFCHPAMMAECAGEAIVPELEAMTAFLLAGLGAREGGV